MIAIPINSRNPAMLPIMMPTLAPVLSPDDPLELYDTLVAIRLLEVVIPIGGLLKTDAFRPMRVPTAGFWLQPALSAIMTRKTISRIHEYLLLSSVPISSKESPGVFQARWEDVKDPEKQYRC